MGCPNRTVSRHLSFLISWIAFEDAAVGEGSRYESVKGLLSVGKRVVLGRVQTRKKWLTAHSFASCRAERSAHSIMGHARSATRTPANLDPWG